jgi:methionyl-tRNA formyltransferase
MSDALAEYAPRIVLLSVDDEYAGAMQAPLYARHPEWVVGSVLSGCKVYGKTDAQAVRFLIGRSGVFYVASMAKAKLLPRLRSSRGQRPSDLATTHGVPTLVSTDINSRRAIAWLRRLRPDLAISTNFSHILRAEARDVPPHGTWNLHKSQLPHYRGMAPSFYALLDGARKVGVTLHAIDDGIDTGPIFAQTTTPVEPNDSVHSLNLRLSRIGGELIADYLEQHADLAVSPEPQPDGSWPNRSYPSRDDIRRFRNMGLRFT